MPGVNRVWKKQGFPRLFVRRRQARGWYFHAIDERTRMETTGIDRMLSQLRTAQALASGKPGEKPAAQAAPKADFADALKASLNEVNRVQNEAAKLSKDFTLGDPNTNLQDVVISMQKSTIAFQQAVAVRNKLVQSYHEIMNMQV